MKMIIKAGLYVSAALLACALMGCGSKTTSKTDNTADNSTIILGEFNADSAYSFIADQVNFGPRVPGTPEHKACVEYLTDKFKQYADSVILQEGEVTAYNGTVLPITNIIAGFNTNATKRIVLAAHYDTRPWADNERNSETRHLPILGANDGGSGTAVLLEIARNLHKNHPSVGVDLILFDAEDYGNNDGFSDNSETWCLGSRYWADNNMIPYNKFNLPVYGILLDMVGGRDARFHYELFSQSEALTPTIKVWAEAEKLGFNNVFIREIGGAVTDDHVIMTRAGIPTTDIIESVNVETSSFPPTWHTHADNMAYIDKNTLEAVGKTVLNVIYKEKTF